MPISSITATIITLNEQEKIRECLESIKWVDEIVVSDSGSSDATVDICRDYGARVYRDQWQGYGRQKNLCQDRASGEWILNIDADERVSKGLKDEIRAAAADTEKAGYYIPRKNYFGETWVRHCGWWPDHSLRLYKKTRGRFAEKRVHEAVVLDGPAGYLKNPLVHLTYKDVPDFLERMEQYSTLAAEEMTADGRTAGPLDMLRPPFTFFKMFVLKLGFLDGSVGYELSRLYASYTHAKYSKLREMKRGARV